MRRLLISLCAFPMVLAHAASSPAAFDYPDARLGFSDRMLTGKPKETTYCLEGSCLRSDRVYVEGDAGPTSTAWSDIALKRIPAVLEFIHSLEGHESVSEWCAAVRMQGILSRPLFCDYPGSVTGVASRSLPKLDYLIMVPVDSDGEQIEYRFSGLARKGCFRPEFVITATQKNGYMTFEMENPTDGVNFFFKRPSCDQVQPPVETYLPKEEWPRP